jgi:hypothetical protein
VRRSVGTPGATENPNFVADNERVAGKRELEVAMIAADGNPITASASLLCGNFVQSYTATNKANSLVWLPCRGMRLLAKAGGLA